MKLPALRLLPILLTLALFLNSCGENGGKKKGSKGPSKEELTARIDSLEDIMYDTADPQSLTKKTANKLLGAYLEYGNRFPEDEKAPEHLFRAAGVARGNQNHQKALNIYNRILEDYPDFNKKVTVKFMIAFIYDHNLQRKEKAKKVYQEVIDSFPDHKFAQQAKMRLKTIHLSDEELIKKFEEKNKRKTGKDTLSS